MIKRSNFFIQHPQCFFLFPYTWLEIGQRPTYIFLIPVNNQKWNTYFLVVSFWNSNSPAAHRISATFHDLVIMTDNCVTLTREFMLIYFLSLRLSLFQINQTICQSAEFLTICFNQKIKNPQFLCKFFFITSRILL
jgi:hypothetical protein